MGYHSQLVGTTLVMRWCPEIVGSGLESFDQATLDSIPDFREKWLSLLVDFATGRLDGDANGIRVEPDFHESSMLPWHDDLVCTADLEAEDSDPL